MESVERSLEPAVRNYLGEAANAGKDTGYSKDDPIGKDDIHYSWVLGRFVISDYTRESDKDGTPVFLKNVGDEVTLSFNLEQDINKLNESKHEYLKEIFNFPDYYGNNLDALYDCMSELDDTKIIILNMKDVNDFSLEVINVFNDVHDEYDNLNIIYQDEEEKEEDSLD